MFTFLTIVVVWIAFGVFNCWLLMWKADSKLTKQGKGQFFLLGPIATFLIILLCVVTIVAGPDDQKNQPES